MCGCVVCVLCVFLTCCMCCMCFVYPLCVCLGVHVCVSQHSPWHQPGQPPFQIPGSREKIKNNEKLCLYVLHLVFVMCVLCVRVCFV